MRPACDVLADEHVEIALGGGAAGVEVQRRVLADVGEAHDLHRVPAVDRRRDLGQVAAVGAGAGPRSLASRGT